MMCTISVVRSGTSIRIPYNLPSFAFLTVEEGRARLGPVSPEFVSGDETEHRQHQKMHFFVRPEICLHDLHEFANEQIRQERF